MLYYVMLCYMICRTSDLCLFLKTEPIPPPKCMAGLGMQSRAIPDKHISASSIWNHGHRAANGRLHFQAGGGRTGAWSAKHNNKNQWLQVYFGKWVKITRISTQGRSDANQWVKSYTLSYSYDGVWWYRYNKVTCYKMNILLNNFNKNLPVYFLESLCV